MKSLLIAAFLLGMLVVPARAAVNCSDAGTPVLCNCVALVSYDSSKSTVNDADLPFDLHPWSAVSAIATEILKGLPVAGVVVYYRQFGGQGGPTNEDFSTDGGYTSWLSLQYIAATVEQPRETLVVGKFDDDNSAAQYQGSKSIYLSALDDTEDVTAIFPDNESGAQADKVLTGNELPEAKGSVPFSIGVRARGLATGAILVEIETNGCP